MRGGYCIVENIMAFVAKALIVNITLRGVVIHLTPSYPLGCFIFTHLCNRHIGFAIFRLESACVCCFFVVLLTLPFNFIRAPGPDNGPGLQLDQESPSLGPLALLGVEQGQHGAQLQVPVQAVGLHRVAALHPRHRRAVGEEARRPGHDVLRCYFPRLLSSSSSPFLFTP